MVDLLVLGFGSKRPSRTIEENWKYIKGRQLRGWGGKCSCRAGRPQVFDSQVLAVDWNCARAVSSSLPTGWSDIDWFKYREGKIDERFREQYERLLEIRNQLDRLSVTQAWSLRETDLFVYQRKLDRIDEARVNGNFVDAEGQPADLHAQRVSTFFFRVFFGGFG